MFARKRHLGESNMADRASKSVVNVCMHKFACINVTPKQRNGAHFTTHAPYCARVMRKRCYLKTTYTHCTLMADSVWWLSQSDCSFCFSLLVEVHCWSIVLNFPVILVCVERNIKWKGVHLKVLLHVYVLPVSSHHRNIKTNFAQCNLPCIVWFIPN